MISQLTHTPGPRSPAHTPDADTKGPEADMTSEAPEKPEKGPERPSDWPGPGPGPVVVEPGQEVGEGEGQGQDSEWSQRVVLNVGGVRHETRLSTLKAIPNTRLSRLAHTHTQVFLTAGTPSPLLTTPTLSVGGGGGGGGGLSPLTAMVPPTEYFFDRHPAVFNSIIDFYRTGES